MLPPVLFDQFAGPAPRTRSATRARWNRASPHDEARRPRPLHPHVQVVLDRVGDGAVALQGLARDERGRVGCRGLGHRDIAARGVESVAHRVRRVVHHRLGELDGKQGVGQMVLDRLEAADRHTELLALLHVVDGHREHPVGQPDELRRPRRAHRGPRRALATPGPGHRSQRVTPLGRRLQPEQMTCAVDRRLTFELDLRVGQQHHLIGRDVQNRRRNIGVQDQAVVEGDGDHRVAGRRPAGSTRQPHRSHSRPAAEPRRRWSRAAVRRARPGPPPRAAARGRARPTRGHRALRAPSARRLRAQPAHATSRPSEPTPVSHAARTASGGHSLVRNSRTASRNNS